MRFSSAAVRAWHDDSPTGGCVTDIGERKPGRRGGVAVDRVLGEVLRRAVWDRLHTLEEVANSADDDSVLLVARSELPRLVAGWRAVLADHSPDLRGHCPACSSFWRPWVAPCTVWLSAYKHLVYAESMSSAQLEESGASRR
jgi:hypothetical protein